LGFGGVAFAIPIIVKIKGGFLAGVVLAARVVQDKEKGQGHGAQEFWMFHCEFFTVLPKENHNLLYMADELTDALFGLMCAWFGLTG
jgi:hypothetical protein